MGNKVTYTPIARNSYPSVRGIKKNVKFKSLKNVRQSNKTHRSSGGKLKAKIDLVKHINQNRALLIEKKLMGVRNNANRKEVLTENVAAQKFCSEDAVGINKFIESLPTSIEFSKQMEQEAIEFWKNKQDIPGFDGVLSKLSAPGSDEVAVEKVKLVLVMTKSLYDACADNDISSINAIKEDVKTLVDFVNKYKLSVDSPIAGSSGKGFEVLDNFNNFINEISDTVTSKGLGYNKEIHTMIMKKIESLPDSHLRDVIRNVLESGAYRESIKVFDKMEIDIGSQRGYLRARALFEHQPRKLDLFKDYLTSNGVPKKDDADAGKKDQGVTYTYNDYSININDFSRDIKRGRQYKRGHNIEINANKPKPQKGAASSSTNDSPEKASARDIGGQRDSNVQHTPETTTGAPTSTARTDKPIDETLTPPVAVGGHTEVDDIDEPALPREASPTSYTHVAQHTPLIGPRTTANAWQYKHYWQSASTTSNNGQLDKKNEPSITPSSDAGTGIKRDSARTPDPHVKAEENPVSYSGVKQKQRGQVATTLTKAKSNAAIVQSVETQSEEGSSPSLDVFIGPNRTGRTGAAEFKRYWKSAQKTVADTDTQAGRQKPLPGDDEKTFLTRSNVAERAKIIEFAGSETDGKTPNGFDTRSPKTTTSPEQVMPQQQSLNSATGTNKQKSDIFMGPHRTGRTGAANFKKYASDSKTPTVTHAPNRPGTTKPDAEPLTKAVSSSTIEKRVVNKTDATIPANRGVEHTSNVAQHKARVEAEATKVQIADDALRADTVSEFTPSSESSLANLHQGAPAGGKKALTDAGNNTFKGPHWTGMQGAAAKQYYMNADRFTKK